MTLQGFKEMDMDVIGDFRYADDEFKDPDDNLRCVRRRVYFYEVVV